MEKLSSKNDSRRWTLELTPRRLLAHRIGKSEITFSGSGMNMDSFGDQDRLVVENHHSNLSKTVVNL
ncbi:hypothetical protein DASC09_012510 [Saccharomycopsis crataegensis]|uniref:Uncharacterized protein n=1 Tax=Saccharomycopsis crataegensis TaxID=43959 RepID=A0AAV5QGX8_9ASCO|nr:hypothetical protein DASC09_012510 [Saccharomycopsis crataegensis]